MRRFFVVIFGMLGTRIQKSVFISMKKKLFRYLSHVGDGRSSIAIESRIKTDNFDKASARWSVGTAKEK